MDVNPILNPEDKPDRIDASKITAKSVSVDKLVTQPSSGSKGLLQFINPTPSVRINPDGTITLNKPGNPS